MNGELPPLLQARAVRVAFPGVLALAGADLVLRRGEVLGLIGENGAGKSTLTRVLAGIQRPDAGEVQIDGRPVTIDGPVGAAQLGIALIHQEPSLCDNLTAAEALFLGRELRHGPLLRRRAMAEETAEWLVRVGLEVAPGTLVAALPPAQRQLLEIARALRVGARVLIMDEPTSSLSLAESERLFGLVRELRAQGTGVIYISHRLAEVRALCDRVMALRDGRNAGEAPAAACDHDRMVAMMAGRALQATERTTATKGEPVLEVRSLRTRRFPSLPLDLSLCRGEIVGIAGLIGAGRSELLRVLFGIDRRAGGEVRARGRLVADQGPLAAIGAGLALVPEDRKQQGLVLDMSVRENLSLPSLRRRGFLIDRAFERQLAARTIAGLSISTPSAEQRVRNLSGGNQQKVVLGRWLALEPIVLLLDEPTRGIDVMSRHEIYAGLRTLAAQGLGVLFASSEMEEVLALADRVLVMREGRLAGELGPGQVTEAAVMGLMTGKGVA